MLHHDTVTETHVEHMTPDEIMCDLSRDDMFPKTAMAAAAMNREAVLPDFMSVLLRLAIKPLSEVENADVWALLPVSHLLAEWRETTACGAFLQILRRPERDVDEILGDSVADWTPRIVAGVFDGEISPIFEAIEDRNACDFARSGIFIALVLIAEEHPHHRPEIKAFVRKFCTSNRRKSPDVLMGWMEAVIDLGLEDMRETVRALFDRDLIPPEFCTYSDFDEALQQALATGERCEWWSRGRGLITDAITELSHWHCYSEKFFEEQRRYKLRHVLQAPRSTGSGMYRAAKIGRNDPCPCGSGKKYKKCCLN